MAYKIDPYQAEIASKIKDQELININEWKIYADSEIFSKIIEKFKKIILEKERELNTEFDYIIGLGASGIPLASVLSQELGRKFLIIDEKLKKLPNSRIILPDNIDLNQKSVLLCDSILRSGYTACNHYNILKTIFDVKNQYLITIIFNQSYFNKVIAENMEDLFFYPLLIWNKDFRNEIQKNNNPEYVNSNLYKMNQEKTRRFVNSENNIEEDYLSFKKKILKLFDEIIKTISYYKKIIGEDKQKDIEEIISRYQELLESENEENYDTQKYYFNLFLKEFDKKDYGFETASFMFSNFFSFTEQIESQQQLEQSNWETSKMGLISEIKKIKLEINAFQNYSEEKKIDILFTISLLNSLIDISKSQINEKFKEKIDDILSDLEKGKPEKLFQLFTDECFESDQNFFRNPLEEFFVKIMYSTFEDLFYSKRYLKNKEARSLFLKEFPSYWKKFLETIISNDEYKYDFIENLEQILSILKLSRSEDLIPLKTYKNLEKNPDFNRFFNEIFKISEDFDEWQLYSNPRTLKIICSKYKEIILNEIKIKKDCEINFFVVGMSGAPLGYCLQQLLRKDGYLNIIVNFIDEKIFTPEERAIKNLDRKISQLDSYPIFIFDSVIKNGFNKFYLRNLFNYQKISLKTFIHYFVLVNYKKFQKNFPSIKTCFGNYKNFKINCLYEINEILEYKVSPIFEPVEIDFNKFFIQLENNNNPYRLKILRDIRKKSEK
ncbi:MAG: phosphoribosyltransferase [Promethearchaeota archaeon]